MNRLPLLLTSVLVTTLLSSFGGSARLLHKPRCASDPVFTVTSGCETATVVVGGVSQAGVKASGKIDPALGNGVVATISQVKLTGCGGSPSTQTLAASCYTGTGNQGVWNVQVKDAECNNKACSGIEVTFTIDGKDYAVTLGNPHKAGKIAIDFGVATLSRSIVTVPVFARDPQGNTMSRYDGNATVRSGSLKASTVKLNGAYGIGLVCLIGGVGTLTIDTTNAISGDTVYFDLEADLLDTNRAGFDIE